MLNESIWNQREKEKNVPYWYWVWVIEMVFVVMILIIFSSIILDVNLINFDLENYHRILLRIAKIESRSIRISNILQKFFLILNRIDFFEHTHTHTHIYTHPKNNEKNFDGFFISLFDTIFENCFQKKKKKRIR